MIDALSEPAAFPQVADGFCLTLRVITLAWLLCDSRSGSSPGLESIRVSERALSGQNSEDMPVLLAWARFCCVLPSGHHRASEAGATFGHGPMVRTSRNTPETTPSSCSSCPRLWPPPGQARTATSQRHHIRPSVYSCRHRRRMHGTQHGMAQLEWPVPHDANHLWMLLSAQAVSGSEKGEHFVCSTLVLLQAKLSLAEWLPSPAMK